LYYKPEHIPRIFLELRGVPFGGQEHSESLSSDGDRTSPVGHLAEDVGRVTEGSHRGGDARQQSGSSGQRPEGGTAALHRDGISDLRLRRFLIPFLNYKRSEPHHIDGLLLSANDQRRAGDVPLVGPDLGGTSERGLVAQDGGHFMAIVFIQCDDLYLTPPMQTSKKL
jgi:hypothetical protein